MLKLLFKLAFLVNFSGTLRAAAKLEYGAAVFCFKLSLRAEEEGLLKLSKYLKSQYEEENSHAKMLGALVDGKKRLKRNCPSGNWDKGGKYTAFDGISQRYWAARFFFGFKKPADELAWADILSFMSVIECIVVAFYESLALVDDIAVNAIAIKILEEEIKQVGCLKSHLSSLHPQPKLLALKWQSRVMLGAIGAVIDLLAKPNQSNCVT
ncbi:ferritin-like domain-containing protein [Aulosira sp. FACHB-615]|uniref:ferritin-like domain-containing protein n=1 Tax=Aulosira sp. FACHB-615 TaxID=2692777 RepID=UPI001682DF5C|nr:ferritin-like domain-containing protein [Aulosira sp. FACHB-615]MBD2489001.1 ferritin-like domain-containing protein [Aulosira sp. FACHB-615]